MTDRNRAELRRCFQAFWPRSLDGFGCFLTSENTMNGEYPEESWAYGMGYMYIYINKYKYKYIYRHTYTCITIDCGSEIDCGSYQTWGANRR
jgi:hypothetical protein